MKTALLLAAALSALNAAAQAPRVFRTQFTTYDTREDALAANHKNTLKYRSVEPRDIYGDGSAFVFEFETDALWGDSNAYLHIENPGSAYTLFINGHLAAESEDDLSPADFMISDLLLNGRNVAAIFPRQSRTPQIQNSGKKSELPRFSGSYIFGQRKLHIEDFAARILPDSAETGAGRLYLDVVVANNFNYEEPVSIGYDITSPSGKLIDYAVREMTVAGHSRDTLRITAPIYNIPAYKWGVSSGEAPLYSLMLYIKRNGRPEEYIPFKTGYGITRFTADGKLSRAGNEVNIISHRYAVKSDRKAVRNELATLKKQGINTIITEFPQPAWFYEECDRAGLFVFDRAAINAVEERDNRNQGGTPSNDPAMVEEYRNRINAMYFRMRNRSSAAGFVLGGETGNGYAMYKAYQYLKSLEKERPVICDDARGEWNTDL